MVYSPVTRVQVLLSETKRCAFDAPFILVLIVDVPLRHNEDTKLTGCRFPHRSANEKAANTVKDTELKNAHMNAALKGYFLALAEIEFHL